jgi:Ca2+-binding RTX toxin-like protein
MTTAQGLDNHFIYDTRTGNLYYDPDGSKLHGKDAIQFATLGDTTHPDLTASDLHIV